MPGQDWDWNGFPAASPARERRATESAKARENAPAIVLGDIGLTLAIALFAAFAINLTLSILNIH
jgi:hypothetical protein